MGVCVNEREKTALRATQTPKTANPRRNMNVTIPKELVPYVRMTEYGLVSDPSMPRELTLAFVSIRQKMKSFGSFHISKEEAEKFNAALDFHLERGR